MMAHLQRTLLQCLLILGSTSVLLLFLAVPTSIWRRATLQAARVNALLVFDSTIEAGYEPYVFQPSYVPPPPPPPIPRSPEALANALQSDDPLIRMIAELEASGHPLDNNLSLKYGRGLRLIGYHHDRPTSRFVEWMELVFGEYAFAEVTSIDISCSEFRDEHVRLLRGFPELRALNLYGTSITDAGLDEILSFATLVELDIARTAVTEKSLEQLTQCTTLRRLVISEGFQKHPQIRDLQRALPGCEIGFD